MEDDVKKFLGTGSSNLLTDWLLKYKLNNISYFSALPLNQQSPSNKVVRKGNAHASKDIIRPTVQLFKHIQTKKRNASPSPQRAKVRSGPPLSPTKEHNKIFHHKITSEEVLDNYKKIYVYGKFKQDKVSRDKIESAVALYRHKDLDKENTPNKQFTPEKHRKVENNVNKNNNQRQKFLIKKPKPKPKKLKKDKIEPPIKKIHNQEKPKSKQKDIGQQVVKENKQQCHIDNTVQKEDKTESVTLKTTQLISNNINIEKLKPKQILLSINDKEINDKSIHKDNNETVNVATKISQNEMYTNIDITNAKHETQKATRSEIIKSLRSKHNQYNIFNTKSDYLMVTQPLMNDKTEMTIESLIKNKKNISSVSLAVPSRNTIKQSVEDLLQAYRIKYRNMIKLR